MQGKYSPHSQSEPAPSLVRDAGRLARTFWNLCKVISESWSTSILEIREQTKHVSLSHGFLLRDWWVRETGVEAAIVGRWPALAREFQVRHRLSPRVAGNAWATALVLKWSGSFESRKSTSPVCILSPVCSFCNSASFFPGSHLHLSKLVHGFWQLFLLLLELSVSLKSTSWPRNLL